MIINFKREKLEREIVSAINAGAFYHDEIELITKLLHLLQKRNIVDKQIARQNTEASQSTFGDMA